MFLQRVQCVEEHELIKLIDELPQYLLAEIRSRFPIIEKDDATEDLGLAGCNFSHEKLEIINVQFGLV